MRILLFISIILFSFFGIKEASAQAGSIATDGVYVPRLTKSQRDAIPNPGKGQMIYNTDDNCFNIYQKDDWQKLCGFDVTLLGNWTRKADVGGGGRTTAVGFSIGNKGYIGAGSKGAGVFLNDFWEYDPANDSWTQKADFAGGGRVAATGFSIGSKGYVGTGYGSNGANNDFWEYDPVANNWTQKANFGGNVRSFAVSFSIGNKGYLGTGSFNGGAVNDFWEYNPANDTWTRKANATSRIRRYAVGFSIGSKGYIGTGIEGSYLGDFLEYDPISDSWNNKANFRGGPRAYAVGFSMGNKGYITTGNLNTSTSNSNEFWEYNPSTDIWSKKVDFVGISRYSAIGFSIGNKGYIGTGLGNTGLNDFWEYSPETDNITKQGNVFNGATQLVKLDTSANLSLNGDVNITGSFNNESFIAPTLLNNWINYDVANGYGAAGYAKNKHSIVQLKGLIKNGTTTVSTVLFVLPVGYRPTEIMIFAVVNGNGFGRVDVYPNGEVRIISGGNAFLSFDNISFRVN